MILFQRELKRDFRSDLKETSTRARFKRGVIHLYNMVVCATGCNPLAYKGYGCYCGFLGSGYVIDGIDQYVTRYVKLTSYEAPHVCRLSGNAGAAGYITLRERNVSGAARCTIGVTTPRNARCSQSTSYHITGDVIVVTSPFAVRFIHLLLSLFLISSLRNFARLVKVALVQSALVSLKLYRSSGAMNFHSFLSFVSFCIMAYDEKIK